MREPPNRLLRVAVPLAFLAIGVGMLFVVLRNTARPAAPAAAPVAGSSQPVPPAGDLTTDGAEKPAASEGAKSAENPPPSAPSAEAAAAAAAAGTPAEAAPATRANDAATVEPTGSTPTTTGPATTGGFTVRKHPRPAGGYSRLGSQKPRAEGGTFELELQFADFGAGVERLTLANHREEVLKPEPHVVQAGQSLANRPDSRVQLTAFSAKGLTLNGVDVGLGVDAADPDSTYWREVSPGIFEATVLDGDGREVLRITRRFEVSPGSYEFSVFQTLANLTDRPLNVVLHHIGPIDQPQGTIRYGGDPRYVRFGYMDDARDDPEQRVRSEDSSAGMITRREALGEPTPMGGFPPKTLWPNAISQREEYSLAWAATTSRYFTVAAYDHAPPGSSGGTLSAAERVFNAARVDRVAIPTNPPANGSGRGPFAAMGLEFVTPRIELGAGGEHVVAMSAYAGPTSKRFINSEPVAPRLGVAEVVLYTFGGPCGFCTFQTLTHLLHGFMSVLHDHVVFDWALAIVVLVLCVRTILHPVTRWSQVNMLRFSKSMQKLAPKQKAIQEKYKNDPVKLREEIGRMMREEHIGCSSGVIGFVPAFLQMPIWLALSATLYFVFELRHQPAFFGVFQAVSGGNWSFFSDLAEPDHFLKFGRDFHIPLISGIMGPIDGLNVMPILMGIVFYIQQKYMTPPPTTTMTPEQEQQMKIMRVMMIFMFPFFMYNAPSGLALYFFINSTLAIVESRHIRKKAEIQIAEEEKMAAAGLGKKRSKPAGPKKEGLLERLSKMAEERQKMMDEAKRLQAKREKGRK